jgi:hypothetical protein
MQCVPRYSGERRFAATHLCGLTKFRLTEVLVDLVRNRHGERLDLLGDE